MPNPALGLNVERGFQVSVFADADLATDIQCLTFDPAGRMVVSGPGYIRTLLDTNIDGRADAAALFATPPAGVQGMLFDDAGNLFVVGGGWLARYEDRDGNGQADGAPENLLPLGPGEHGGHAIHRGPDGWLYVVAGNDAGVDFRHANLPTSPFRQVEAGALLRLARDGRSSEVIAQGFRNPYDFAFNSLGDLFTYDSDMESDLHLPWYAPTRIYHIAYAGHHGWRLPGWRRSWPRPPYYPDTIGFMQPLGRGSPTGVAVYRHTQFPAPFREGLFVADWTFGRVLFLPLQLAGATYTTQPEPFITPVGTQGFAPTALAVAPSGSLFVAIGGRRTRGAVYQVAYVGGRSVPPPLATINLNLNAVLQAPEPLTAWSRADWIPLATEIGPELFARVAADAQFLPAARIRALEVLTELFGGVPPGAVLPVAQANSPLVRARLAWSIGRAPTADPGPPLLTLALDPEPFVRRCALEAVYEQVRMLDGLPLVRVLLNNFAHGDKRVRYAAARVASRVTESSWITLTNGIGRTDAASRLTARLVAMWRAADVEIHPEVLPDLAGVLNQTRDPLLRRDAIRMVMLALGDWNLRNPSLELYSGYELSAPIVGHEAPLDRILRAARLGFPSRDPLLDYEISRLFAMVRSPDRTLPLEMTRQFSDRSSAASDFHYLICLSRLGWVAPEITPVLANTVLSLGTKVQAMDLGYQQSWPLRLGELIQQLLRQYPGLADALVAHPRFVTPGHVTIALQLQGRHRLAAARAFQQMVRTNPQFPWSIPLIDLLSALPAEERMPLLREQWSKLPLRNEILLHLAEAPALEDREKFLAGLISPELQVAKASLQALKQLGPLANTAELAEPLLLLQRLLVVPEEQGTRAQVLALLSTNLGRAIVVRETTTDPETLRRLYQPVFEQVTATVPQLAERVRGLGGLDPASWEELLRRTPWERGDARRGQAVFVERGCQTCHNGPTPIGPDLTGLAARLSLNAVFHSILYPSLEIAAPFRTTDFTLRDGDIVSGLVTFESNEAVIVQTSGTSTVRLNAGDILARTLGNVSLMPTGLLNGMTPAQLADLYAYLRAMR